LHASGLPIGFQNERRSQDDVALNAVPILTEGERGTKKISD